jgi:hypothetical protein
MPKSANFTSFPEDKELRGKESTLYATGSIRRLTKLSNFIFARTRRKILNPKKGFL